MAANLNRVLSSTPVVAEESSSAGPHSLYSSSRTTHHQEGSHSVGMRVATSNSQTLLGDASLNSLPTSMSSFSHQDYSGSVDINGRRRSSSTSVLSSFKTAVNENANGFYPNQLHLDPKEKSQSSFNFLSKSFASSTLAQGPIVSGERKRPISSASSEPFLNDHRQVQLHSHSTSGSHSEPQTAHPSNESQFWESANQINPEAVFYPTFLGRSSSRSMTLPSSINSPFNLSNQSMLPEAFTAGSSPNGNGNGGDTQDQSVNGQVQEEGPTSDIWKEFTRIAQEGIGSSTEESENEEEVELEQAQTQAQAHRHRLPSMSNGSTSLPNTSQVGGKEAFNGQTEGEESLLRQGTAPRDNKRSGSSNTVQDRDEASSEKSVEETVGKAVQEKVSEEVEKEVDEIETETIEKEKGKEKEKRNEEENEIESRKEKRKESEEKNEIESEKEKEKDKDNDKLELTKTEDGLLPRLDEKAALEKFNSITLDRKGRPNCSYAIAIRLAILSSPGQELDLQKIYSTLMDKFKFYSDMGPKFKNSVRYNLTINRAFIKIARDDGFKPGNVWKVNEDVKPGKVPPKRSLKKSVKKEETTSEDEEETKVIQNGIGKNRKRSREEQESNSPDSRHERSCSEMNRGREDRSSRQVGRYESNSRAVDSGERSSRKFETAAPRVEPKIYSSLENGQTSRAFGRDHHRSSSSLRPAPQSNAQSLPKSIISTLSGAAEQNFSGRRRSSILPSINSLLPEEPFNANLASEVGNQRGDQSPYNHKNSKHLHQAHTSNPFTYSNSSSTTAAPSISLYTSTPSPSHSSPRHSIQFNFPPTSLPGPPNQAGESIFAPSQRDRASRDVSERRPDYSRREVGPSRTSIGPSWAGMGLGSRLNSASSNHAGSSLNAPNDDDGPLDSELEPSLSSFMRKRRISSDSAKLINGLLTKNRHASYTLERRMSEKSLRLEEDIMKEGDALDHNSKAQDQVNRINGSRNEGKNQHNGSQVDTRSENRIRASLCFSLQVPQAPQVPAEWSNFDSNSSRRRSSGLGLGSNRPSSIYQSISPGTDPTQGQNSPFRWNVTSENRVGPSENRNPSRQTTSNQSVSESPFPPDYRPVTAFSRDSNPPVNKFDGTTSSTSNVNKNGTSIPTLPPFEKNFSLSNPSNAQSNTLSAISPLASSSNPPEWNYQSFNPPHTSSPLAQNPVTNFPSLSQQPFNRPSLSSTPTSLASPFSSPLSRSHRDLPALDSPRSLSLNSNPFDTSLNSRFK